MNTKMKKEMNKNIEKTQNEDFHKLLNEKQAAEYLGLSVRSLQQRRYLSQSPSYIKLPDSATVRYRLSVLREYVAEGEVILD